MDYRNSYDQFQSDALRELDAFDIIEDEQRVEIDKAFNEAELEYMQSGVSDNISIISKGMTVDGNLESASAIALNGRVNGNITTSDDIGVSGTVVGDIKAESAHFQHAAIKGDSVAARKITVEDDTVVVGNLTAAYIGIDSKVKGKVTAGNKVEFRDGSLMVGEVITGSIHMEERARVNATITLTNQRTVDIPEEAFDLEV